MLSKWNVFPIKCRPQSKSRNLEQTLALRMYTKGSDAPKMLLFRAFACEKRVPERGEENDRKKMASGLILDRFWLRFWLRFGTKMDRKTRSKKRGPQKKRMGLGAGIRGRPAAEAWALKLRFGLGQS